MLIRRAEIEGCGPLDVRIVGDRIAALAPQLGRAPGEEVLDAEGGALLPGLHDHHLHLLALAAAERSVRCGPPEVRAREDLARALSTAAGEWIRGVGYHESVAGLLDRMSLDALVGPRPARIQHRSGALWMLSSAAVERVGLDRGEDHPGVERDARGRATGRVFRADRWLRERLGAADPPDLAAVGRRLSRLGVTGASDATATNGPEELALLARASLRGDLPQRLLVMGGPELPVPEHPRIARGARKIALADDALPDPDALAAEIAEAHARGRGVAIHCVTRAELVVATAALAAAGPRAGDRIEHAAVAPPELVETVAALGITVVAQPVFVHERGDAYRAEVDPRDLPWLHRLRGFLAAGVPLGGGSDAPFGDPDPWAAMRAAVERRTESGEPFGADETLSPEQALALFISPPESPGGLPRRIASGAVADLCLLDRPWREARHLLSADLVRTTLCGGRVAFSR